MCCFCVSCGLGLESGVENLETGGAFCVQAEMLP